MFDQALGVCNWPYQVSGKCGLSIEDFRQMRASLPKAQSEWREENGYWTNGKGLNGIKRPQTEKVRVSDKNRCYEEGFKRDEHDCRKFYQCVLNDQGGLDEYKFFCPSGLAFDEQAEVCNWPHEVPDCPTGNCLN